jgi:threonine dehydrogenase-like Zn-dependent dehydrogenase
LKALLFGAPPDRNEARPKPTDELEERLVRLPFGLHEMEDAHPIRPDWVVTKPILSGVCGSDSKLVLGDFADGDMDNPMAAFSSLPHVPGHEVVAEVVSLGPEARGFEVGERVVLNPWLSCVPRGIEPICPACAAGDLNLCRSFTKGDIGPGVHVGVVTGAPGAWAELMAAHPSMLHRLPDGLGDEAAVVADPFSVSFHSVVRHPPPSGGRVVVFGAGALGLLTLAILRSLYPSVEVAVVARFPAQAEMARRWGASVVFDHEPRLALVEALGAWSGGVLHQPFAGLPMCQPGHVDVVYDTVAKPETFEVAVRVLAERGRLVYTGVAVPGRWEWTPVYFKELTIVGSNAFAMEDFEGKRQHAIEHYFDLVTDGRITLDGLVTHQYRLGEWWDALLTLARPEQSGVLKATFAPNR